MIQICLIKKGIAKKCKLEMVDYEENIIKAPIVIDTVSITLTISSSLIDV